jgi:hypothetical protein
MMQFDKFLSHIFFINVTIRECNFAMGTILGKGFAPFLKIVPMAKLDICRTIFCSHQVNSGKKREIQLNQQTIIRQVLA